MNKLNFFLYRHYCKHIQTIVGPINKVGFILLFGYCQASSRFYTPAQFRETDVQRVCADQNIAPQQIRMNRYHLRTCNNHKRVIREYLALQSFDEAAGDGRKVELAVESLNANHSFKYFGSGIGSSLLYSCIDEMNRVFYNTMISSSDREAAYVADAFLNNLSIKTNIHSTDTLG